MASDKELFEAHRGGRAYRDIANERGLSTDSVRSRISRYSRLQDRIMTLETENRQLKAQLAARDEDDVFGHDLGKPWYFEGDFIIVGDVHVSTTKWNFAQLPLEIASRYLSNPRRLILAGDMLNADHFSDYPMITPLPSFAVELKAARVFLDNYLKVFDEIYIFLGNHDRRVQKATNNAIAPEDLLRMVSHDVRVQISHWGHCVVNTPTGEWRILHGSEYSVNQLAVADQLAQKYQQHIIGHHQHHLAVGWSRFKQYVVIDNGGLFDQNSMAYTQLDDNKKPRMANGFTMLKDGHPYVFGQPPFTDWNYWLGKKAIVLEDAA